VETARRNHGSSPLVTAALGRLMMAGLMMGAMNKGDDELITLEMHGDGPIGGLTVTANNKGQVKGFANHPNVWLPPNGLGKLDVGGGVGRGTLTVVRDLPGMAPYTSQTELVSGEVGDDLAAYFTLSDQVPTSVGVGVLVAPDAHVLQAGGFIVQLMPDHEYFLIDELERNLRDVTSVTALLERGMGPSDVLRLVLAGLDYEELEVSPVEFYCGCNKERATRATLALGRAELEDMVAKGEAAEVHCHFCGTTHYLSPDELRALLEDSPVV
jgi:molecular chaperone Hsp33